jgi:Secretion system C-terminal sorting domain
MKQIFRTASFLFIVTAFIAQRAFAQQPLPARVLFETFTNSAEPCPDPNRAPFETAAFEGSTSTASEDASKIVTINYHVGNFSDQLATLDNGGGEVDTRLSGTTAIYTAAVNRSTFPQDGQRIDPPTTGTGSYSDWGTQIGADYTTSPKASITLNFATLDKTNNQSFNLHLDLTVTANQQISDSLIIRYAITQDKVSLVECGNKTPAILNAVAMYVSNSNASSYIVCLPTPGMSAGSTQHMTANVPIDQGDTALEHVANMNAIAFLEDDGGGDYNVVDAVVLKQDIDTLQPPPPTLTLTESSITGDTLHPGLPANISYSSTNLPNGVMIYYSLDDGTNWRYIENSTTDFGNNWTVPDSLTTQGKIKLVAVGDTSLTSTEIGTFTIANPPSVTFIQPQPEKIIKGDSAFTIYWTKVSVDSALLRYSLDNGVTFKALQNNADTFYVWNVPDTNRGVIIQLVPDGNAAPTAAVIDTIESTVVIPPDGVAANSISPSGLTITNIFPNPASNGEEMVVQYFEAQPKPITVQLLDLLGRVIPESYTTDNLAIHLNTNLLAAGAYVVRVSDGTNTVSKRVEIIR